MIKKKRNYIAGGHSKDIIGAFESCGYIICPTLDMFKCLITALLI